MAGKRGERVRNRTCRAKVKNWRELPEEDWWVEGNIFEDGENSYILEFLEVTGRYMDSEIGANVIGYEVDPETICESVGLTDANNKKIFEEDIVRNFICIDDHGKPLYEFGKVVCDMKNASGFMILDNYNILNEIRMWGSREVIGNIFDNPELIEGIDDSTL